MNIGKQAKVLNSTQVKMVAAYLKAGRNGLRNETIFLLSAKGGLRAKEIAELKWEMVLSSHGDLDKWITLPNNSTKGKSGRVIPMHPMVRDNLEELLILHRKLRGFNPNSSFVICTERSKQASAQVIVNMFQNWYCKLGLVGCSSHSGRRTFITDTARKISLVGGSIRDVQRMAGHSSLHSTQRYIEVDADSQQKVMKLI